ncbi:MAG: hypothetical protein Q7R71_02000 [bacterium]|nr:hypothetical protein [bacterium]
MNKNVYKTLALNPTRGFIYVVITALFSLSLLLAVMPTPARAAGLTEPQIQATLDLLVAFDADQATISNTEAALRGTTTNKVGNQTCPVYSPPLCAAGTHLVGGPMVNGCQGAPQCVADDSIGSDHTTSGTTACPAGQTLTSNGKCVSSTTNTSTATTPTVAASAAPTCTLKASSNSVAAGSLILLTWASINATYSSSPNGNTGANGSVAVTPMATTIYQKTVYGPGGSATCQVMVSVTAINTHTDNKNTTPFSNSSDALNPVQVMAQPEINLAGVAVVAMQWPFSFAIDSLVNIFVQLGVGQ